MKDDLIEKIISRINDEVSAIHDKMDTSVDCNDPFYTGMELGLKKAIGIIEALNKHKNSVEE